MIATFASHKSLFIFLYVLPSFVLIGILLILVQLLWRQRRWAVAYAAQTVWMAELVRMINAIANATECYGIESYSLPNGQWTKHYQWFYGEITIELIVQVPSPMDMVLPKASLSRYQGGSYAYPKVEGPTPQDLAKRLVDQLCSFGPIHVRDAKERLLTGVVSI